MAPGYFQVSGATHFANSIGNYESIFSYTFNMINTNGSSMYNHTISGSLIGKPKTRNSASTITGFVTVNLEDEPHSQSISIIKFRIKKQ